MDPVPQSGPGADIGPAVDDYVQRRAPEVARRAADALRGAADSELADVVHRCAGTLASYGLADAASLLTVADTALGAGRDPASLRGLVSTVVADLDAVAPPGAP